MPDTTHRKAMRESAEPDTYVIGHVRSALAEDPRVNQLDLDVKLADGVIRVTGDVPTVGRQAAVGEVAAEHSMGRPVRNGTRVVDLPEPDSVEELL